MKRLHVLLLCISWIPLVLLAAVIADSRTGWIVRDDVISLTTPDELLNQDNAYSKVHELAMRNPDDYMIQLVAAQPDFRVDTEAPSSGDDVETYVNPPSFAEEMDAQELLCRRFSKNASAYANVLRLTDDHSYQIEWSPAEKKVFPGTPVNWGFNHGPDLQRILEDKIRDGRAGEALDPDNAYFPTMLACAYFAAHRDDFATAEIIRAGRDDRWDDYCRDDVRAKWRSVRLVNGGADALDLDAVIVNEIMPDLTHIRAAARMSVWCAMSDEMTGKAGEGIAIRHGLLRIADLMRSESSASPDTLMGVAIGELALTRPGGLQDPIPDKSISEPLRDKDLDQLKLIAYQKYLDHSNRPDEAAWVAKVDAACALAKDAMSVALSNQAIKELLTDHRNKLLPAAILMIAGLTVLLYIAFALITAAIAAIVARRSWLISKIGRFGSLAVACAAILLFEVFARIAKNALISATWFYAMPVVSAGVPTKTVYALAVAPCILYLLLTVFLSRIQKRKWADAVLSAVLPTVCLLSLFYCVSVVAQAHYDNIVARYYNETLRIGLDRQLAESAGKTWPTAIQKSP